MTMNRLKTICVLACLTLGPRLPVLAEEDGLSRLRLSAAIKQIKPEAIRAHTRFLADDVLEGRGTGTRGYELAAKYVAAHFEAFGLEPVGTNDTYFQTVPLRRVDLVPAESSLTL